MHACGCHASVQYTIIVHAGKTLNCSHSMLNTPHSLPKSLKALVYLFTLDKMVLCSNHAAAPSVTALQQTNANSSSQFTLICTSTTSPATTVVWTKDGTILSFDGTPYQHSQVVTDRQSSTYDNILTSTGTPASTLGKYTCTVSNRFGTSSRSAVIEGTNIQSFQ